MSPLMSSWQPPQPVPARVALETSATVEQPSSTAPWMVAPLTPAQRQRTFTHPDFGELNVEWVAAQMAGHDLHHLKQFEQIARG